MPLSILRQRWLPYLLIAIFIIAKIPHLYYAFYWDESWVYAPAIYLMYAGHLSLLPGAIPVDYSRGHPLLYHWGCAGWMRIFGSSHFSMHCFALLVSIVLAIAVYEVLARLFSRRPALIALLLLLLNLDFFTNSTFLLTDVMLALFVFLSLYAYVRGQYFLTAVFLTLLVFTKESGLVGCVVIDADIFYGIISRRISLRTAIYKSLSLAAPLGFMLLFFIIQKRTYGWYMYPSHISAINFSVSNAFSNILTSFNMYFLDSNEWFYFALLALIMLVAALRFRNYKYFFAIGVFFLSYLLLQVFSYKDVIYYPVIALILYCLYRALSAWLRHYNIMQRQFIVLSFIFCGAYTYFCCINFFEKRYLFPAQLLLSIVLPALAFGYILARAARPLFAAVLCVMAGIGMVSRYTLAPFLHEYDRMDVQQQLVTYFVQHNYYNKRIYSAAYLEKMHLTDAKTGFLPAGRVFAHVSDQPQADDELIVVDNIDTEIKVCNEVQHDTTLALLQHFRRRDAWAEVYQKKR